MMTMIGAMAAMMAMVVVMMMMMMISYDDDGDDDDDDARGRGRCLVTTVDAGTATTDTAPLRKRSQPRLPV